MGTFCKDASGVVPSPGLHLLQQKTRPARAGFVSLSPPGMRPSRGETLDSCLDMRDGNAASSLSPCTFTALFLWICGGGVAPAPRPKRRAGVASKIQKTPCCLLFSLHLYCTLSLDLFETEPGPTRRSWSLHSSPPASFPSR